MTRTDKYQLPFLISCLGFLAISSPTFLKLGSQMPDYMAIIRNNSQQKRLRNELEERRKTSNKLKETGLVMAGETLTLSNYLDDPKNIPKLRETDLNRYGKDRQAVVFDAADKCIGLIKNQKFISKHHNPDSCQKIPLGD